MLSLGGIGTKSASKSRVILSLDARLLSAIDTMVEQFHIHSRSAMLEDILRRWYRSQQRAELERQTEAYYISLPEAELEEDRPWVEIASEQAERLWSE